MNNKTYGKENDLNLKVLIKLTRATQKVHKQEYKTIKKGGLTVSQFGVLEVLYHKGDLRIRDIIDKTLSTGGNMTVVIDNLEKENLIRRYPDPTDRRATLISITEKGKELMDKIFPSHVENINDIFSVFSEEEKNQLIKLLRKLNRVD
ncbi:MarR family transcriptional regulator [Clostridium sp. D2Q-11]|uniref:MarR family transcriptional regulator n=1 Tax=Anaeromonas frigoriresistens TaxID=2683708 RepID=A0A942Z926_9FIRM|nr:MarR family transcriptional regulator [Anaeromonas frigoriresistens]MBS4538883.1 MarR family transcriptional regulator [Anaeromonas frigoriresistens]